MLGEPTTPLFCIAAFMSSEPNQPLIPSAAPFLFHGLLRAGRLGRSQHLRLFLRSVCRPPSSSLSQELVPIRNFLHRALGLRIVQLHCQPARLRCTPLPMPRIMDDMWIFHPLLPNRMIKSSGSERPIFAAPTLCSRRADTSRIRKCGDQIPGNPAQYAQNPFASRILGTVGVR
jgi:hypothetical protein